MTEIAPRISLDGMLDFIPKSRRPLAPLFEAISNALEAISERQRLATTPVKGLIMIRLRFTGLLDEQRTLESVEIADNGIGFDDDNYERFRTFLDRSKGYKNRGSGRIQFLHFAERVEVTSHYEVGGQPLTRHFVCNPKTYITDHTNETAEVPSAFGTTVVMSSLLLKDKEREFFDDLTLAVLRGALKSTFLLRLHLERVNKPDLAPSFCFEFFKNGKLAEHGELQPADIPVPETGAIKVAYVKVRQARVEDVEWVPQARGEDLNWAHFKLDQSELEENGVLLCSKNVAVLPLRFDSIKKGEAIEGHRFLTAIHGPALDSPDNVSHSVDRFTFPMRADKEKEARDDLLFDPDQELLLFDDIKQAVEDELPRIYADLFEKRAQQDKDIEAIARAHGIPLDVAKSTRINLTDTEAQITEKMFKKQAEGHARQSVKIKKVFEALEALDPTASDYHAELERRSNELLELIPEQNKLELSRYIIRRQMVAKVLGLILDERITAKPKKSRTGKKPRDDREGLVHDLLIKRKSTTAKGPNELWVLNEEFVHFEGCSELPLDQIADAKGNKLLRSITPEVLKAYGIKPGRRPDIFLYLDEAQCILIELKAPEVDLSEYLNQLPRYCNLIGNFAVKPIMRFYCYLIGETINHIDVAGEYRINVHGDWVKRSDYAVMRYENGRQDEEIGKAQIEIIKLSSLRDRALRRNKSFADRLGIGDEALKLQPVNK